jgi:hypothetical protein
LRKIFLNKYNIKIYNHGKFTLSGSRYIGYRMAHWVCWLWHRGHHSHFAGYCNYCHNSESYPGKKYPLNIFQGFLNKQPVTDLPTGCC